MGETGANVGEIEGLNEGVDGEIVGKSEGEGEGDDELRLKVGLPDGVVVGL